MIGILKKIFGTVNDRIIKKLSEEVKKINAFEAVIQNLSNKELKNKTTEFKQRLKDGSHLDSITYEAFAVVKEAAHRLQNKKHFDVQLIGGLVLHKGMITEMRTGEGKTLTATLAAYLNALSGKGVHIITVNDYLAKRDANWVGDIYRFLGLSVEFITSGMKDEERRSAYQADITYVTNNELGFDFLRDNMKYSDELKVLRELHFAIVDEVDSILIDESRTPLIISGPVDDRSDLYVKIDKLVSKLSSTDYEKDEKIKTVHLTEVGINKLETLLSQSGLIQNGTGLYDFDNLNIVHYINQSLRAHQMFVCDVDYLVKDGKVMIIDEFTGRVMEGRRYSDGLHQALEAKEGVAIQNENQTLASITFQNYFRMYPKLSGMTGTASTEAFEFKEIYNLDVVTIPTHHPVIRADNDDEIYGTKHDKYNAIVNLVKECQAKGQPVLVGTVSIEKSEEISQILHKHKITHNVLNAKFHEQEANIIAQAGRLNAVTIATNMAGRGTDIMLGGNPEILIENIKQRHLSQNTLDEVSADSSDTYPSDSSDTYQTEIDKIYATVLAEKEAVKKAGGLCIIGTERHESRRIDNQLRGRSGRQGDPGITKFFLSLEDDLMRIFASDRVAGILRTLGLKDGEAIFHPMISRALEKAQQKVEANNFEIRKNLLRFDDVMNDQRKVIYQQRIEILAADNVDNFLHEMTKEVIKSMVLGFIQPNSYREDWDIENLITEVHRVFGIKISKEMITQSDVTEIEVEQMLIQLAHDLYQAKDQNYGIDTMNQAKKYLLITTLDQVWKDHLHTLDHLRHGIFLRSYGQKDPLNEYKREAFNLFEQMLTSLSEQFIQKVSYLQFDINKFDSGALSLKEEKLSNLHTLHTTREDPAFSNYNSGSSQEITAQIFNTYIKPEDRVASDSSTWGKIQRNELCPCLSGKKYKHCHGSNNAI